MLAILHTLITGVEIIFAALAAIAALVIGYKLFDNLFRGHHERQQLSEQTRLLAAQRQSYEQEQEHKRWLQAQQLLHQQQIEAERLALEEKKLAFEREKLYLTTGVERERVLIPEGNMLVWQEQSGPRVFANPRNFKQIAAPLVADAPGNEAAHGLQLAYPEPVDFAEILASGWRPTPQQIFMFLTVNGALYDVMEQTCHIALAGPTGGGKTTLLRLLLAQFLYCGADIWLANPNFAPVKLNGRTIEDWRPIVNAMNRPVARKIDTIKGTVESTLTYLDDLRDAQQSSPLRGNDVYLALGEWIAIQSRWKDAAEPVGMLLREARQYGIHIISELQDALVKSSGLSSGLRESFRNAYYFGGDPTTARALLDLPAGNKTPIEETTLGKMGTAIFRGNNSAGAVRGRVPFLSNRALYMLLGEPETPLPDRLPEGADPVAFFRSYGLSVPQQEGEANTARVFPAGATRMTGPLAQDVRALRPGDEPAQESFLTRNEARQEGQQRAENGEDGGEDYAQKTGSKSHPDAAQGPQNGANYRYRLSDKQAEMFRALYPDIISDIDECLKKVGANSAYRAHARDLIDKYNLRRKG